MYRDPINLGIKSIVFVCILDIDRFLVLGNVATFVSSRGQREVRGKEIKHVSGVRASGRGNSGLQAIGTRRLRPTNPFSHGYLDRGCVLRHG